MFNLSFLLNYDKLTSTPNQQIILQGRNTNMSEIKPLARRNDIVIQEFGNEILIYDLTANKAFNLNETSTLIWQLSNGDKTISEIANDLSKKFNSNITEEFVWLALEQLRKEKLVENEAEIIGLFEGVSRREIIRKVGLGSLVAFPTVSSLIAPMAIQAQSGCIAPNAGGAAGCPCSSGAQCPSPISCCSNIPAQPRVCVGTRTATGLACGLSCECVGNCCVGNICSSNTVSTGNPCINTCQCIGSNTCQSNLCCPTIGGCP